MRSVQALAAGFLASAWPLAIGWSQAQQAATWSGPFVSAFGTYARGSSTQNDNGFAVMPPGAAAPAPPPPQ